ncbi:MAG: hypothetical protein DRO13_00920 [Thermoprotei archaeon]|nr:MAG: hypothetical protein DRO13_00920 [Thermoprotei archaeon]
MDKRVREIGIKLEELDLDKLSAILEKVEREISNYLKEKIPRKAEYDLVLCIDRNDKITLYIDLRIIGIYDDIINYDRIVGDAINVARKAFEREIRKYRKDKGFPIRS